MRARQTARRPGPRADLLRARRIGCFYDGEIDGIKGKRTRKAIREFQSANGLTADGIVGKKTWELLAKYAQDASGGAEEGTAK